MPSEKGSQGKAATVLREAARQLIVSIDATSDRAQKRRLAEQAFELLRQAATLAEQENETEPTAAVAPIMNPTKSGA
jgi:hypothetical protein